MVVQGKLKFFTLINKLLTVIILCRQQQNNNKPGKVVLKAMPRENEEQVVPNGTATDGGGMAAMAKLFSSYANASGGLPPPPLPHIQPTPQLMDINALHPTVASLFSNQQQQAYQLNTQPSFVLMPQPNFALHSPNFVQHHPQFIPQQQHQTHFGNPRYRGAVFVNSNFRHNGGQQFGNNNMNANHHAFPRTNWKANGNFNNNGAYPNPNHHFQQQQQANFSAPVEDGVSLNQTSTDVKQFVPLAVARKHQHARTNRLKEQHQPQ